MAVEFVEQIGHPGIIVTVSAALFPASRVSDMPSSQSRDLRWALAAMMAASVLVGGATLQQTPPQTPPQQPPVFRTGTELVRVDATVFDKKGQPVTDLSERDFEVMEDGVSQPIKSFKLVEVNGTP